MAIRPNGNIDPCVFFPRSVGNVRNDRLEDIWLHDGLFKELRDKGILKGNCGTCDYRHRCGGCRARSYGYTGDHLAPDPGCIRNSDRYRDLISEIEEPAIIKRSG